MFTDKVNFFNKIKTNRTPLIAKTCYSFPAPDYPNKFQSGENMMNCCNYNHVIAAKKQDSIINIDKFESPFEGFQKLWFNVYVKQVAVLAALGHNYKQNGMVFTLHQ